MREKSTLEQMDEQKGGHTEVTHACKKRKFEDFSFETKGKILFEKKRKENERKMSSRRRDKGIEDQTKRGEIEL